MTGPIVYVRGYLNAAYAHHLFNTLRNDLAWERREDAPRSEYWTNDFGQSYTYGHGRGQRTYEHRPMHMEIDAIRKYIEQTNDVPQLEGCFLNMYEDGTDALGWHSDDDPGIDHTRPIAVVTLGQGRTLQYKKIGEKGNEAINSIFLEPGSLLLMNPGMQQTHLHRIPKVQEVIGPRISLTYRGLTR